MKYITYGKIILNKIMKHVHFLIANSISCTKIDATYYTQKIIPLIL